MDVDSNLPVVPKDPLHATVCVMLRKLVLHIQVSLYGRHANPHFL